MNIKFHPKNAKKGNGIETPDKLMLAVRKNDKGMVNERTAKGTTQFPLLETVRMEMHQSQPTILV